MHYYSPSAYRYLAMQFPMPTEEVIRGWLNIVEAQPGFTAESLTRLQQKFKDATDEREAMHDLIMEGTRIRKRCDLNLRDGKLIGNLNSEVKVRPRWELVIFWGPEQEQSVFQILPTHNFYFVFHWIVGYSHDLCQFWALAITRRLRRLRRFSCPDCSKHYSTREAAHCLLPKQWLLRSTQISNP